MSEKLFSSLVFQTQDARNRAIKTLVSEIGEINKAYCIFKETTIDIEGSTKYLLDHQATLRNFIRVYHVVLPQEVFHVQYCLDIQENYENAITVGDLNEHWDFNQHLTVEIIQHIREHAKWAISMDSAKRKLRADQLKAEYVVWEALTPSPELVLDIPVASEHSNTW